MKLGIMGAGMIVRDFLTFAHEVSGLEIVAICATANSEEKLQQMCEAYHINSYYLASDQLFADDEVEVVYVATPNHLHY